MPITWTGRWRPITEERRQSYIAGELAWELSHFPEHPLRDASFRVVAMMDLYDNAIIQFSDGSYGYVLLTWKAQSPYFERIGDEEAVARFFATGRAAG